MPVFYLKLLTAHLVTESPFETESPPNFTRRFHEKISRENIERSCPMHLSRPDLSAVSPQIAAYIEALEAA